MKLTLLQIVQAILSSMDSDEVNSINDTVEAQQVALVVRTAYFDLASRIHLPEHFDIFQLTASGDSEKPTLMYRPDTVRSILWLKYNREDITETDDRFTKLTYLNPHDFFSLIHSYSESDTNVGSFEHSFTNNDDIVIYYRDDGPPNYYTMADDKTVLFDSYDSEVDSTLQKSKTLAYGEIGPIWEMEDSFMPDLDEQQCALLLNEAKVLAFSELKQVGHQVAASNARRQWIDSQVSKKAVPYDYYSSLPNYGRRR